jgi:hypothetical protein
MGCWDEWAPGRPCSKPRELADGLTCLIDFIWPDQVK